MSRELDAEVAEKVMEFKVIKMMPDYVYVSDKNINGRWHPSGSIFDAWMVVEKMREMGYWMRLYHGDDPCAGTTDVSFHKPDEGGRFVQGQAPEAICRAALAAVEGKGVTESDQSG